MDEPNSNEPVVQDSDVEQAVPAKTIKKSKDTRPLSFKVEGLKLV